MGLSYNSWDHSSLGRGRYNHIDTAGENHAAAPDYVLDMNLDNIVLVHWDGYLVGEKADFEFDHWVHLEAMQRVPAVLVVDWEGPLETAVGGCYPPLGVHLGTVQDMQGISWFPHFQVKHEPDTQKEHVLFPVPWGMNSFEVDLEVRGKAALMEDALASPYSVGC